MPWYVLFLWLCYSFKMHLYIYIYIDIPWGGIFGGSNPPEIPTFWQNWAEFPFPWKIRPLQPKKNTGFTHLPIEQNTWLGGYRPQIPVVFVLNCTCRNFLGMPLYIYILYIYCDWSTTSVVYRSLESSSDGSSILNEVMSCSRNSQ
jgi:hypothetical protein